MGQAWTSASARDRCVSVCEAAGIGLPEITAGLRLDGREEQDGDRSAAEACFRAMFAASLSFGVMGQGTGWTRHQLMSRMAKLGLRGVDRIKVQTEKGEIWKKIPGWPYDASNRGRIRSRKAPPRQIKPYWASDRLRVRVWGSDDDPGARREFPVASAVLAAFRGEPIERPAAHLNGDFADCRLTNLKADRIRHRPGKRGGELPWTKEEDRILRQVSTVTEAITLTGRTSHHVRQRMDELGIVRTVRKQARIPLADRNIETLQRAVAALERAGIADRDINLALGILGTVNRGQRGMNEATDRCVAALFEAGFTRKDISVAFGWTFSTVCKRLISIGLTASRYAPGAMSKLGPADAIPGEIWRPHPWGYQVSNMGRVLGRRGDLLSQGATESGRMKVALRGPDGRTTSVMTAALVLSVFKPEMPYTYRRNIYLNGDVADARLTNLVGDREFEAPVGATGSRKGQNTGSATHVPYLDPLRTEADQLVPRGLEPHERDDLISDMVVMVIEGEVKTMKEALGLARTRYNRLMGVHREKSLDAPMAGTDDLRMIDLISNDTGRI